MQLGEPTLSKGPMHDVTKSLAKRSTYSAMDFKSNLIRFHIASELQQTTPWQVLM